MNCLTLSKTYRVPLMQKATSWREVPSTIFSYFTGKGKEHGSIQWSLMETMILGSHFYQKLKGKWDLIPQRISTLMFPAK
jgi:hypothetical protein